MYALIFVTLLCTEFRPSLSMWQFMHTEVLAPDTAVIRDS